MKLDKFLLESFKYMFDNINTLKELQKVCEFVESPQKTVKMKKNCQYVLENQYDLKPEKHTNRDEKKSTIQKTLCNRAFFLNIQVYQW